MPARQPNFVEVVGSKGTLQALISRGGFDALRRSTGGEWIDVTLPAEAADGKFHALRRMMHAFVDGCLRGKLSPGAASFEDGLAVQHMIASAEESARAGGWAKLRSLLKRISDRADQAGVACQLRRLGDARK